MNNLEKYFREEWEALILAGVVLLLLIAMAVHFSTPPARKRRGLGGGDSLPYSRKSLEQELAALEKSNAAPINGNPFAFTLEGEKPSPPPPPPPSVEPVTAEPPPPAETDAAEAPVVETLPPPPPETVAPARPRMQNLPQRITYLFFGQDDKGQTTAMLKVQLQGRDSEILTLSPGDQQAGITILSIREQAIRLRDAQGREVTIQYGENRVVTARVEEKTP